jgi:hypothetical protein
MPGVNNRPNEDRGQEFERKITNWGRCGKQSLRSFGFYIFAPPGGHDAAMASSQLSVL